MGANATLEEIVPVVEQVMGGDGGTDVEFRCAVWVVQRLNELHRLFSGDVLEHNLQGRVLGNQRLQNSLNEDLLSIKYVNAGVCNFSVDQKWQSDYRHRLKQNKWVSRFSNIFFINNDLLLVHRALYRLM